MDAVCIESVHWAWGHELEVERVGGECGRQGVPLVVDATQSAGIIPMDVQRVRPDFLMASAHKWLYGPHGLCLLYASRHWFAPASAFVLSPLLPFNGTRRRQREGVPLEQHERAQRGSEEAAWDEDGAMTAFGYPLRPRAGGSRFDGSGRPNPLLLPVLAASLQQALRTRQSATIPLCRSLCRAISECAKGVGLSLAAPEREQSPHILGLQWHGIDGARRAQRELQARGVFVSVRVGVLRVSVGPHNGPADATKLCNALPLIASGASGQEASTE